jgi:hypothetical protein
MSVPGFFTAVPDYGLPHPQIPLRVILTTHLALVKAFELLRAEPPVGFLLPIAKEDEITQQLHWIMENRLLGSKEVAGFDRRRIKNVIRAPEVTNHDGQHPAKQPDLVLFLLKRESSSVLHSHDGLFAECKPVDDDHPIGSHYCDGGIRRFVNGDYAWAMQEGMVVAYVRGGRTISRNLAPALASQSRHTDLGSPAAPMVVSASRTFNNSEALQSTLHQRSFTWPAGRGTACKIRIFHSWHNCS